MALLRSDMQRSETFAIALVDYESSLLRIKQLFNGVVASIPCRKVQWRLIVVIFQVYACAQSNQILQRSNVPLTRCIMKWRATRAVLLVEEIAPTALCAGTDFFGELFQSPSVDDNQVQQIPVRHISQVEISAHLHENMHGAPATAGGCQQNR